MMTKDLMSGIVAVIVGLAYLAGTFNIPVYDASDIVGPRSFPFLIAAVSILCGIGLIVTDLMKKERKPFSFGFVEQSGIWIRILATIALGIGFGLVLDKLGYLIAMFLFMIGVSSLCNVGRHKQNLIIALSFALVSYIGFALLLKLSLPRGLLSFLPF